MTISMYSLKTGILLILVLILMAAMILLDIIMIRMTEKDLLRAEIQRGEIILNSVVHTFTPGFQDRVSGSRGNRHSLYQRISNLSSEARISAALILDPSGKVLFEKASANNMHRTALFNLAKRSLHQKKEIVSISSAVWGLFSPQGSELLLSAPLSRDKVIVGAASIQIPLAPMYHSIRESQKIVFFYILFNALVLGLLGFYLLYRSLVRPINRLVKRAEQFKEGESFFPTSTSGQNEFGKLSKALNFMIRGLEESKAELKTSISSLESANVELRQAQEEIIRSEKLASIGRLSSGIAHEIGNPIGIVLGYLDLLKGTTLDKEEEADIIDRIGAEIDKVNRTIRNLLDFSRTSKGEVNKVSVHHIITDMLEMLKPQPMMADVTLSFDQAAGQDEVLADADKLKQVFLNIVMNAIDAMEANQAGTETPQKLLSITTASAPTAASEGKSGHKLHIRFVDNGPGISTDDISRIFDPFYTTKEPGKGTGLGLSVSLRIAEDMGGDIKAASEPGKGTTITVILPLYSASKTQRHQEDSENSAMIA
ncbi:MAG: ATP-binding protein [Thermodesulfobacteriota bacterium]